MVVDCHQHFWKYNARRDAWITDEMQVLKRDFLPPDLKPLLQNNQVDGCVVVQADQSEKETQFLLDLSQQHDFILGVVGWVDLRSPDLHERLAYYSQFKKIKGFRHVVQAEPDGFLSDKKFIAGVQLLERFNFTYDLLIYHHQLADAITFLKHVAGVKIVIDHLAKPSIKTGDKVSWEQHMRAAASFQNVYCKLSGMVTEADWQHWKTDDFVPYLEKVFDFFGIDRLMYGSDWPVCLLASSYDQQLAIVKDYIDRLSNQEKQMVMGENAKRFYNL